MSSEGSNFGKKANRNKSNKKLTRRSVEAALIRKPIFRKRESREPIIQKRKTRLY
jgi:hypothetical protein